MPRSSPRRHRARSDAAILAGLTLAGLAIRLAFVAVADRRDVGFNDQFVYHVIGASLDRGQGYSFFGEATLRWPPAFPFLLSLVYRVFHIDVTVALITNAVLSAAVIPLTAWAARPFASRRASLWAAAAMAVFPGQWLFAGTILSEPLATIQILLVLGLVLRHPPGPRIAVVLGLLVGFAALTRGEGALLGLVVLVAWWARPTPVRRLVVPVGITAGVAILLLVPWVVRNSGIAGEPTGVSLNVAETLYSGHNPKADGGATYATREVLLQADPKPFGPERELEIADHLQGLALEWAREHPREELELIPKKLAHLAEGDGRVISIWIEAGKEDPLGSLRDPLITTANVAWYALFGVTVVTLIVRWRALERWWAWPVLTLPAVSLVLYGVILYGNFRYRVPYEPLLALLVAGAWSRSGSGSADRDSSHTATHDLSGTDSGVARASS